MFGSQRHDAQIHAATALANLVAENRDGQVAVAKAGAIPLLLDLLAGGKAQEATAHALGRLAFENLQNQQDIVKLGGIAKLLPPLSGVNTEAQVQAAAALAALAGGERNKSRQNAIAKAGGVRPLLALVDSRYQKAQCMGLHALAQVAMNNRVNQDAIAELGGLPPLVGLVSSGGSPDVQMYAARGLAEVVKQNYFNQSVVSELGVISMLVSLLRSTSVSAVEAEVAGALRSLVQGHVTNQASVASAGAINLLVGLLGSRSDHTALHAGNALIAIGLDSPDSQRDIAKLLVGLLTTAKRESTQERAAAIMWRLVRQNPSNKMAIAKAGGAQPLVRLLREGPTGAREFALWSLSLCIDDTNQQVVIDAGAIKPLVESLSVSDVTVNEQAASALNKLATKDTVGSISQAGAIGPLIALLDTNDNTCVRQYAAGALSQLAMVAVHRPAIERAGGIAPLVALLTDPLASGDTKTCSASAIGLLSLDDDEPAPGEGEPDDGRLPASPADGRRGSGTGLHGSEERTGRRKSITTQHTPDGVEASEQSNSFNKQQRRHSTANRSGIPSEGVSNAVDDSSESLRPRRSSLIVDDARSPPGTEDKQASPIDESPMTRRARRNSLTPDAQRPVAGTDTLEASPGSSIDYSPATRRARRNSMTNQVAAEGEPLPVSGDDATPPGARRDATPPSRRRSSLSPSVPTPSTRPSPLIAQRKSVPRKITIAQEGAIAPLVALLSKDGESAQEEAAGALRELADNDAIRLAITEAGGIGPLVTLLGGSNPKARENAEGALVRLSLEMANRVLIIEKLVGMLYKEDIAAREQAAAAIANLAHESTANCTSIVDAGGILPLLALLDCESSKAKENSAGALKELARGSRPNQNAITKAGGVPLLVAVLTSSSSTKGDTSGQQLDSIVTHAIWMMAKKNFANQVALYEAGVITPLVSMLGNSSPELQLPATGVIECLLQSRDIQAAVVRTGAIAPLCMLSRDAQPDTQEQAAAALWSLAKDHRREVDSAGDQRNAAMMNRTTIAKLGGIESLIKMFHTGGSPKSQRNAAGALTAIAIRHSDNRQVVARKLVNQLGSGKTVCPPEVAARTLAAISFMCGLKVRGDVSADEFNSNQLAIAKCGGVTACIAWLKSDDDDAQTEAAHALLALATHNITTQTQIAKPDGLQGLISVIRDGCNKAQEHAASALWHLAFDSEIQHRIAYADGISALVGMLEESSLRGAELSAVTIVRLAQGNAAVATMVAEEGGIMPLVKLLHTESGAATQAAATLAELALVAKNRDPIANASGIDPLINLLGSRMVGTPETAARALAHIASADGEDETQVANEQEEDEMDDDYDGLRGAKQRRAHIDDRGGITQLIAMLDGSNLASRGTQLSSTALWGRAREAVEGTVQKPHIPGAAIDPAMKAGMQSQAAAALAEFANGDEEMQDAIIDGDGVPKLLALVRDGVPLGQLKAQEHAVSTLWHLTSCPDNQEVIISSGCVPELITLVRASGPVTQEVAMGAVANIAQGSSANSRSADKIEQLKTNAAAKSVVMRDQRRNSQRRLSASLDVDTIAALRKRYDSQRDWKLCLVPSLEPQTNVVSITLHLEIVEEANNDASSEEKIDAQEVEASSISQEASKGLTAVIESSGIPAIVTLMNDKHSTPLAKQYAAAALFHLAHDSDTRDTIAECNGIPPLVNLLKDGTQDAHHHASDALARLANQGREHQSQIAKKLASFLMPDNSHTVQHRAAHALQMLAVDNPGSHTVIVKAGVISPLVHLLSTSVDRNVRKEAADALETLVAGTGNNEAAVYDLVVLLGTGSMKAQELVAQLMFTLCGGDENRAAIAKSNALDKLLMQLTSSSLKVQEMSAAVLASLSADSKATVASLAKKGAVQPLVEILKSENVDAHLHAAACLADLTTDSEATHAEIVNEGGIVPLVDLLSSDAVPGTKSEAAGALGRLCEEHPVTALTIVRAGAIEPLVKLLEDEDRRTQRKAAATLATVVSLDSKYQNLVVRVGGIPRFVRLLGDSTKREVQAYAATALSKLVHNNPSIQTAVTEAGGIPLLVTMMQETSKGIVITAAATALRNLAAKHPKNRTDIAAAGGVLPLVMRLAGADATEVQEAATDALVNLSTEHPENEASIATLLVKLLNDANNEKWPERGARAVTQLARNGSTTQDALANAGAVTVLVKLLQECAERLETVQQDDSASRQSDLAKELFRSKSPPNDVVAARDGERMTVEAVQLQVAAAIRAMTADHPRNRKAFAACAGIALLVDVLKQKPHRPAPTMLRKIDATRSFSAGKTGLGFKSLVKQSMSTASLLSTRKSTDSLSSPVKPGLGVGRASPPPNRNDSPEFRRGAAQTASKLWDQALGKAKNGDDEPQDGVQGAAAGALWSLAADKINAQDIAAAGAVPLLMDLLKTGSKSAQETAAGTLCTMASFPDACKLISESDPIPALESVLDEGLGPAKQQAAGILKQLAESVPSKRASIAQAVMQVLSNWDEEADLEQVTQLSNELCDVGCRDALAEAGAITLLGLQIERGSEAAGQHASKALGHLAKVSSDCRGVVIKELLDARYSAETKQKRARLERALESINADSDGSDADLAFAILMFRMHTRD